MTESVKSLADEIQTSVERLVQQFADAGIKKTASDNVSQQEKEALLAHLNREQGGASQPGKLTLQRKTRSTLSVPVTGGKSKSVNIEVRKKRTYVNRDAAEQAKAAEEQAQREAEEQARREAEEQARREAEEKARQEAQAKREAEEKAKREAAAAKVTEQAAEPAKREAAEKNNVKENKAKSAPADTRENSEKVRREAEAAEIKRKAEEEQQRKLEAEVKRAAEEARRLDVEYG